MLKLATQVSDYLVNIIEHLTEKRQVCPPACWERPAQNNKLINKMNISDGAKEKWLKSNADNPVTAGCIVFASTFANDNVIQIYC